MGPLWTSLTLFVVLLVPVLEATPRIIGGDVARAGQFPFAAAIQVRTQDSTFFCGGVLLEHSWILTAGVCVYRAALFTIQLGSNQLQSSDPNRMTVATSSYVLHPEFDPETIEHDLGLIKLREPVQYTAYVTGIHLREWPLGDSSYVYGLGWGQTSDGDGELSNDLKYVTLTTLSNSECQQFYGDQITENMVCVEGNYNEGTCIGDNGSPLVSTSGLYYSLVGVSSFVSANGCESTFPSGYTRTLPYFDWIRNVTAVES